MEYASEFTGLSRGIRIMTRPIPLLTSGMLCKAMASAVVKPSFGECIEEAAIRLQRLGRDSVSHFICCFRVELTCHGESFREVVNGKGNEKEHRHTPCSTCFRRR